ncbi:MAG: imidazoleglycerol-phosphate dehydratase HisB [Aigarchaeota archaeon]|nr:imidazoleglycerol-phosphate dehydratase HisB [Candidatus Pelearchaeum maunauluense]
MRAARMERKTAETSIEAEVNLDGKGVYSVATGIKFLDHMLATLSKHSLIDINLRAEGDLRHHIIEDVGIVLGRALSEALGERRGIKRFGYAITPMDEALALAAVDLVKRPKPVIRLRTKLDAVEDIPVSELAHFLESFATSLEAAVHVRVLAGGDDHHKVEAAFKALALALRQAIEQDPRRVGVPSTKGSM